MNTLTRRNKIKESVVHSLENTAFFLLRLLISYLRGSSPFFENTTFEERDSESGAQKYSNEQQNTTQYLRNWALVDAPVFAVIAVIRLLAKISVRHLGTHIYVSQHKSLS